MIDLLNSDARRIPLADQSVQCIITSPPYWGLRDYGTATWQGGEPACDHVMENRPQRGHNGRDFGDIRGDELSKTTTRIQYRDTCAKCGAIRIDAQIGLERVPDCLGWAIGRPCGECYVCHIVAVMRECWRVLRDDGVLWLNLGDSYARQAGDDSTKETDSGMKTGRTGKSAILFKSGNNKPPAGLKPKDLCMVPARVALALQAAGWYLRSEIVWSKPNPMPESVTDRPTKAHEMIYLLTKEPRYYYDAEAIREPPTGRTDQMRFWKKGLEALAGDDRNDADRIYEKSGDIGRNRRGVWTVATSPYSGAKETADYVGDDGKPYKASVDCPIHGHLARDRKSYILEDDGQQDQIETRNLDSDNDHEQVPASLRSARIYRSGLDERDENAQMQNLESIGDYRNEVRRHESTLPAQTDDRTNRMSKFDEPSDRTSNLKRREYSLSASGHNKRKSKTARARRTSQHDNASEETRGHKQNTLPIAENIGSDGRIDENNSAEDYASNEMVTDPLAQKTFRNAHNDNPFDTSHMKLYCTCEIVSTDHFATFPPALVEPMILAGTSARGACPTCGMAWRRVIERSGEIKNTDYENESRSAMQRGGKSSTTLNGVPASSNTLGWRPACACYDVPPLPDEPDDTSNGDMAAYRAERARLLDLYATLPVVPCIVLDPFAGSGTVGKVAVKHGRRFVGCELNREYIDLAFERTSKVQVAMQL